MTRLDWLVPNQTDTFIAIILAVQVPDGTGTVFSTAEMGILDNKVHLVTTKENLFFPTAVNLTNNGPEASHQESKIDKWGRRHEAKPLNI